MCGIRSDKDSSANETIVARVCAVVSTYLCVCMVGTDMDSRVAKQT